MSNISNTMTDRHIVNVKVNQQLDTKRKSAGAKKNLNTFFCGTHPLDSFAKVVDTTLKEFENGITSQCLQSRNISGAQALANAASKMAYKDGCGVPAELRAFLVSKNIMKMPLLYFVGSRFHVLFHNCGAVYYLKPLLEEFLVKVWGAPNRLLQAIQSDLKSNPLIIGCRALGLLGKQFTGPWMAFTMVERPILELNDFYKSCVDKLTMWCEDATELLLGEGVIFNGIDVKKDAMYEALVKPCDIDNDTKLVLQRLCKSILTVCERQLVDQLPGGQYSVPETSLMSEAASCTANNISGERVFALLDSNIHRAPHAKMDFLEAKIKYKENQTALWLESKDIERQKELSKFAKTTARSNMVKSRGLEKALLNEKIQQLRQKRLEMEAKGTRLRDAKENALTDLIQYGGVWKSEQEMQGKIKSFKSNREAMAAVKNQLKVRKTILEQKPPPDSSASIFAFSYKGKQFPLNKLCENLLLLIQADQGHNTTSDVEHYLQNPDKLQNRVFSHMWTVDEQDKWFEGEILNMIVNKEREPEFRIRYAEHGDEDYFLTLSEIITDVKNGEFLLL